MTRPIEEGARVLITHIDKGVLFETVIPATVLHVPCDTGDWWHFEDENGKQFALNPCSSGLHGIRIAPRKDDPF